MNKYKAYFDGACRPKNPCGYMGIGAFVELDGKEIWQFSSYRSPNENNSNNRAEYMAFYALLDYFVKNNLCEQPIEIMGDSQLVVKQMNGEWAIKGGRYGEVADKCKELLGKFSDLTIRWIPREQNSKADALSNKKLDEMGIAEFKKF